MRNFTMNKNCCGCGLCEKVCPRNAITMLPDDEGFMYPRIDEELCVNCGICDSICVFRCINHEDINKPQEAYAVKNKNAAVQIKSSSGGVFYEIAKKILEQEGVVYGAAFQREQFMKVEHIRVTDISHLDDLLGSKYVQSSLEGIYESLLDDLINEKTVLFCGTPCQVDSVKEYLKYKKIKALDRFYAVDFICHGVPSPQIWEEYIGFVEKKRKCTITNYSFRYKSDKCRWGNVNVQATMRKDGNFCQEINTGLIKTYINMYFGGYITRSCCGECPYANESRVSDISLADCWGIEAVDEKMYDPKGVSLVLLNSEKGSLLFDRINESVVKRQIDYNLLNQPHLKKSYNPSQNRDKFWKYYRAFGFEKAARKYAGYGIIPIMRKYMFYTYGKICSLYKYLLKRWMKCK